MYFTLVGVFYLQCARITIVPCGRKSSRNSQAFAIPIVILTNITTIVYAINITNAITIFIRIVMPTTILLLYKVLQPCDILDSWSEGDNQY